MSKNLTPKQRRALEALLTSGSMTEAAERAEVHRDTLYRWLKQPEFKAALDDGVKLSISALSRKLVGLGEDAINALSLALTAGNAPVTLQVRAADIVLGRLLALRELHDLEERLSAVEEALKKDGENERG